MIIRTSDLGYDVSYYNVSTDATTEQIKDIEFKNIPCHRSASTTIKQLKTALEEEGFVFEVEVIAENLKIITEEVKNLKVNYEAHYGNY